MKYCVHQSSFIFSLFTFLFVFQMSCQPLAFAEHRADKDFFEPKNIFGDGSHGRVFRQWTQQIAERPVEAVSMVVTKRSGGGDTYLNLRFGKNGGTFENFKRVYLSSNQPQTIQWNVGGQLPKGEPLILNVYSGEAYVESVIVRYRVDSVRQPPEPPTPPSPRSPRDHGDRGDYWHHGDYDRDDDPRSYEDHHPHVDNPEAARRCRYARARTPRIEIGRIRSDGNFFSNKYKVEGAISGACIQEAGYYEYGRLKERIEILLDDRFHRQEFEVKVRSGKDGEIRAYTVDGAHDAIAIDDEISRSQNDTLY